MIAVSLTWDDRAGRWIARADVPHGGVVVRLMAASTDSEAAVRDVRQQIARLVT